MEVRLKDNLALWVAQGFGAGRSPVAPGTFGSMAGLLWFALLVQPGALWLFCAGTVLGLAGSVWCCGAAERILKKTDPPSVVLDELAAIPACFLVPVLGEVVRTGQLPGLDRFFTGRGWVLTGAVFLLFRLFDILKPWPVRQIQKLPGGWGVTADNVLAAVYVNLLQVPFQWG